MSRGPKRKPLAERFWAKVVIIDDCDSCWLYTASRFPDGYGRFGISDDYVERAHRVSYLLHHGELPPEGQGVLHSCDTKLCVRPKHLYAGTQQTNLDDAVDRRRFKGMISDIVVQQVRMLYSTRRFSERDLAAHFGISRGSVNSIIVGRHGFSRRGGGEYK